MDEVTSEVDEEITKQDAWMEPLPEPLLIILSPPPPFLPRPGKPTMVWQKWLKAFEHYVEALGENELSDSSKCVLIQNCLGPEGQHIYTTLFQCETTYTAAISGLTVYFTSDPTSQMYRLIFHHRAQMPAETVDQFVFALTELLRPCNYGDDLEAKLILDQLIKKTNCPQLGERLLLERETMTLDKAMVISKEVESALNECTMFGVHEVSVDIGDDLDPPVPIKYKRGRPRRGEERPKKTITKVSVDTGEHLDPSRPMKRKRGRPRRGEERLKKTITEVSVDIGDDLDRPLPIKYKRGRPRLGEERPKKTLTKTKPCLITPTSSSKPCLKKTRGRPSRYRDNDCNSDNLCFSENYGDEPKTVNETNPACDTANDKAAAAAAAAAAADDQGDDDDDDDVVDKDDDDYRPFSTSEPIEEDYQDQGSDAEDYKTTSGTRTKLKGPYCPICIDRRFKSAHKLARHMRTHTKEKPFCCPHCPVTFSQSYHMTRHLRNQHGAGQHVCSTCGENQGSLEELKIHKRTHVPKALSCPVCNQIFTSNAAFMAHTVSHCMQTLGHSSQQSDELENRETIASCDEGNSENDDSDEDGPENDADSDFTVPIVKKEKSRKGKAASKVGTEGHFCPHCPERRFKGSNKLARHMRTHTKEKPFSCPECSLSFSQSYHMTRHLRKQHGSGKYICTKCGKSLNSWLELKTHRKTHAVEGLTCLACDKHFKEKAELVKHLRLHKKVQASPRSLVCGDCGKVFGRMYHLKRHIVTHRKATNGECYTCPNCQKTFAFPEDLNKHLEIHVKENSGTCPKCNENFGSPEELEAHMGVHEKSYACSICGKKFKVEYALKKHEQGHQNEQYYCELCCKRFVKLSHYRRHIMVHNRRETRCPHCDSVFLKVNALKYHLRTHTEERPYQCTGCIETFVEAEDLEQHRLKHRKFKKERPYSCTRCDCAYSTLIELTEHMSQHEGEQPQNCPVCGKSFLNKNKLEKHLSIHTGERPHLCSICGNGFPSAASLKLHAYIHTGEKPFQCSQCSKTFSSSSGLRLHGRQHMEVRPTFICPECGRTYGRMTELKMHQRYHTGDKPYACTCCNKRFISKDKLNVHMRIHTGERPYSCPRCGQTFTQTGDRNRHISKFHDGLATELF